MEETVEESPVEETVEESPVQETMEEAIEDIVQESLVQKVIEEDNKPLDTIKEIEYESTYTEKRDERDMSCDSDAITVPTINNPHPTSN